MEGFGGRIPCQLNGDQLLVKRSYVNGCLTELKTQVMDELHSCLFLRVVRLGPEIAKNKSSGVHVGSLVALHSDSDAVGKPLKFPEMDANNPYYIVKLSDVVGVLEF